MEERYTWIPFYAELAKALLAYKNNRKPLVDFVYSELSTVGGRSLVDYIHMEDAQSLLDFDKDKAIELISSANVMLDLLLDKGYDYDDVEQYVLKRLKET